MPYYCTVPRCTSMAGKAKNVSFHQFPRDEELARLWNDILKRGKPYTKYSKVCSLHFKPEDYTITSVGKNKGQWRTLRKDAVPSQNLPSETPAPYSRKQWDTWTQNTTQNVMDSSIQQQMAQAIYMQTMLAMQAAGTEPPLRHNAPKPELPNTSNHDDVKSKQTDCTYKCTECTKCFKDPDVFILHKRTHTKDKSEKENFNMNLTLRSNPILANLLKTGSDFDPNISAMENLLMTALAANMDYLRNFANVKDEHFDNEGNNAGYREVERRVDSDRIESRDRIDINRIVDDDRDRIDVNQRIEDRDSEINRRTEDNRDRIDDDIDRDRIRSNATKERRVSYSGTAFCDLNRLKSDLNRRSVEMHVRTDLTQPKDSREISPNYLEKLNNRNHPNQCHIGDLNGSGKNYQYDESINETSSFDENEGNNIGPLSYAMTFKSKEITKPYSDLSKHVSRVENLVSDNIQCEISNDDCKSVLNSSPCDNDMNESMDSNSLVIDESV